MKKLRLKVKIYRRWIKKRWRRIKKHLSTAILEIGCITFLLDTFGVINIDYLDCQYALDLLKILLE